MLGRWISLIVRTCPTQSFVSAGEVFEELCELYRAPTRRYHDLRHIQACLQSLDAARSLANDPDAVELALWFHDAIYDPQRQDNEDASAKLAQIELPKLGLTETTMRHVADLILATRHDGRATDADAALIRDIDLAILGQPAEAFRQYEISIREEYDSVPDTLFRAARSKVLQSFLDRRRIYLTDHFFQAHEVAARDNIAQSLRRMSMGC